MSATFAMSARIFGRTTTRCVTMNAMATGAQYSANAQIFIATRRRFATVAATYATTGASIATATVIGIMTAGKRARYATGQGAKGRAGQSGPFLLSEIRCADALCAAGELARFGGDFYFFALLDEEWNADLDAGLERGGFGHGAAGGVATNSGFGVGDFEFDVRR